jgi:transcriptional regulator with GAF, ATPase, and Fis domain
VIHTRGKSLQVPLAELNKTTEYPSLEESTSRDQEQITRIARKTITELNDTVPKRSAGELRNKQFQEISRVLGETKGRVGGTDGAAARMGLNRTTLLSRMRKFGIDPKTYS